MYYWNEKYENIWDSAPRPKYREPRGGDDGAGQCVCKDKTLRDQLEKLLDAFSALTTSDVTTVAQRCMKDDVCCCNKNYCKHEDTTISDSELDSDMWDLYTFFLNEFNTKTLARPGDTGHSPGGGSEPSPGGAEASENDDDECIFNLFSDSEHAQNLPQCDPVFKLTIMKTMRDCITHRDIHRFHLLQHTKLVLYFFSFKKEVEQNVEILPPPGD